MAPDEGPPIPKRMVDRLRRIDARLPETTLKVDPWGYNFQIRRRTYAFLLAPADPQGVTRPLLILRADELERHALLSGGHPYFPVGGGHDRLGIVLSAETDWEEIGELVTESYRRLAPKKLVARLDEE
jgi:hypothetical protein